MKRVRIRAYFYRVLVTSLTVISFGLWSGCKVNKPNVRYGVKTPSFQAASPDTPNMIKEDDKRSKTD